MPRNRKILKDAAGVIRSRPFDPPTGKQIKATFGWLNSFPSIQKWLGPRLVKSLVTNTASKESRDG